MRVGSASMSLLMLLAGGPVRLGGQARCEQLPAGPKQAVPFGRHAGDSNLGFRPQLGSIHDR